MTADELRELEQATYAARRRTLYGDPGLPGYESNRTRAERYEVETMRAEMGDCEDD